MSPAAELLREEIRKSGPVAFSRFMEVALYHPEYGYYRGSRDPFGRGGDYYTAAQIEPVFGLLVARIVEALRREAGSPPVWRVVDLGGGRGEMGEFLGRFGYVKVEAGEPFPDAVSGVVLANEFFDALPVDVAVRRGAGFRQRKVGWRNGRFVWVECDDLNAESLAYLERFAPATPQGAVVEIALEAQRWIERIARRLEAGYVLIFDYGYDVAERIRFPEGTLMSYRRHQAIEDVLTDPGEQDITAHVCWGALEAKARECGLRKVWREGMSATLLRAGEGDQFREVLEGVGEEERRRRLLQIKTLVVGMGETFQTLLLGAAHKNGPGEPGPHP